MAGNSAQLEFAQAANEGVDMEPSSTTLRRLKCSPRTYAVVFLTAFVLAICSVILSSPESVASVRFDWDHQTGFKSIHIDEPSIEAFLSPVLASQAKPMIAASIKDAGWKSAKGVMSLRVRFRLYVSGIVHEGSNITDPKMTPLMSAADNGDLATIERLLLEHVDIDAQDQSGWTALMHAAMNGRDEVVKVLLEAGANPNLRDRFGRTAFLHAAWHCRYDAMLSLLAAGAKADVEDSKGSSALSMTTCPTVVQKAVESSRGPTTNHRH